MESKLITLIEESLVTPETLNISSMRFPQKTNLAIALGLLEPDVEQALLTLNDLRNKFAHDLDFRMSELFFLSEIRKSQTISEDLERVFPELDYENPNKIRENFGFSYITKVCITILLFKLENAIEEMRHKRSPDRLTLEKLKDLERMSLKEEAEHMVSMLQRAKELIPLDQNEWHDEVDKILTKPQKQLRESLEFALNLIKFKAE